MKKLFAILLTLALLTAFALADNDAELTISGSATISVAADYATARIGVTTTNKNVGTAMSENAETINAVLAALKEAGIKEEDIVTNYFDVSTEYNYTASIRRMTGYTVTNSLTVTFRDMTCIGAILDKAAQAGANDIGNISFESSKMAEAADDALIQAFNEAKRRAQLVATAAGKRLGDIEDIQVQSGYSTYSSRSYDMIAASESAKFASNIILPDDFSLSCTVTVVFELQ